MPANVWFKQCYVIPMVCSFLLNLSGSEKKNLAVFNCAAYSVKLGALLQTALYKSDQLSAKKTRPRPDTIPPTHTKHFLKIVHISTIV